jgi:hypothetical protein
MYSSLWFIFRTFTYEVLHFIQSYIKHKRVDHAPKPSLFVKETCDIKQQIDVKMADAHAHYTLRTLLF